MENSLSDELPGGCIAIGRWILTAIFGRGSFPGAGCFHFPRQPGHYYKRQAQSQQCTECYEFPSFLHRGSLLVERKYNLKVTGDINLC